MPLNDPHKKITPSAGRWAYSLQSILMRNSDTFELWPFMCMFCRVNDSQPFWNWSSRLPQLAANAATVKVTSSKSACFFPLTGWSCYSNCPTTFLQWFLRRQTFLLNIKILCVNRTTSFTLKLYKRWVVTVVASTWSSKAVKEPPMTLEIHSHWQSLQVRGAQTF